MTIEIRRERERERERERLQFSSYIGSGAGNFRWPTAKAYDKF
jgi:hypothetical protein